MEIGVDIVEHKRVNTDLARKILTKKEKEQYDALEIEKLKKEFLASRFAAKEAIIKATNKKYFYNEIEVLRTEGKPKVNIEGILLTLSHEDNYSVAFCINTKGL